MNVSNLQVDEITRERVEALPQAEKHLSSLTRNCLLIDALENAPDGTRFFLLTWFGDFSSINVNIGDVEITATRRGNVLSEGKYAGQCVRLEGADPFVQECQQKIVVFLYPSTAWRFAP